MKGRRSLLYRLRHVLLGVMLLSAYQFYDMGRITWHLTVLDQARQHVAGWLPGPSGNGASVESVGPGSDLQGLALSVRDGDTFVLRADDLTEYRIRLHGVDSPELDQPYGREAGRMLARQIEGRDVTVRVEDIDQYGRQVGVVFHAGENVNLQLVREGHAWWYRQYARSDSELAAAEERARAAGLGLWALRNPVEPWDWRRRNQ